MIVKYTAPHYGDGYEYSDTAVGAGILCGMIPIVGLLAVAVYTFIQTKGTLLQVGVHIHSEGTPLHVVVRVYSDGAFLQTDVDIHSKSTLNEEVHIHLKATILMVSVHFRFKSCYFNGECPL